MGRKGRKPSGTKGGNEAHVKRARKSEYENSAELKKKRAEEKRAQAVEATRLANKYVKQLKGKLLQPSRKHYGGLGYAKDSVFLDLSDPDYNDKFEKIWDEHIKGFSGKSFKKRKNDSDHNMLWRQRLTAKTQGGQAPDVDDVIARASSVKPKPSKVRRQPDAHASMQHAPSSSTKRAKRKQDDAVVGDAAALQAEAVAAYRALKAQKTKAFIQGS
eukprot:TRINITY_DN7237_c0_g1_i1.p1 TRINITY_DN7237_c0_g1~~TRINITY_DN7237_c0_g1_i1.p1  ORF type:complete len:216 (-),score=31.68 TRINITY_DN7237_c0_g1_i1:232-879(-)